MKITKISAGHSLKVKVRPDLPKDFTMAEFSSYREAELEAGENPTRGVAMLGLLCRQDVLDAFRKSGLPYQTPVGIEGQDRNCTDERYVQIGQERPAIVQLNAQLREDRENFRLQNQDAREVPNEAEEPEQGGFQPGT
jgi:hypothetical protein